MIDELMYKNLFIIGQDLREVLSWHLLKGLNKIMENLGEDIRYTSRE
jgi:hypothetical protein